MMGVRQTSASPHNPIFYCATTVIALPAASIFIYGTLTPAVVPIGFRFLYAILAVVFLTGTVQAIERLVWPERARRRSSSLSAPACRLLQTARTLAFAVGSLGIIASAAMFFAGSANTRGAAHDVQILSLAVLFIGGCLGDLRAHGAR